MDRGAAPRPWSVAVAIGLLPVVVVGVLGTWIVSGATFATTTTSTGLSGGDGLIGAVCILAAITLGVLGVSCMRSTHVELQGAFRRALLFGGTAGVVACGVRVLLAADWTVSSSGRALGIWHHPGWGAWLTTACFAGYAAAGFAEYRRRPVTVAVGATQPVGATRPVGSPAPPVVADVVALLQAAIVHGDEASRRALLAAGPEAVKRFGELKSGTLVLDLPRDQARFLIDSVTAVSCDLGSAFPAEYAAVFADPHWIPHGDVLLGLGYTRRPEAVPLLLMAMTSSNNWSRMHAAIALRWFGGPEPVRALTAALNDRDELVRHHAHASLVALGAIPSA
ncbi:MAG TPA: HEAT repeat domain-containing protein [Mycobacteriales bacterium]|nr:HEAT repeat domain-containing protein [Mycobacteriales bacterium]